ncbi:serine hydrolase [Nostoc sp. CCY0012]|uniref:serine hydrolase n=1 Tax=Nostoc sp. CCY0012 TaxID=1056123 RepID=UPI0039C6492A
MSESSDNLKAFPRRQPTNRRSRQRPDQKVVKKKVKVPIQPQRVAKQEVALTRFSPVIPPSPVATGAQRSKSRVVMPTAVKPIPHVQRTIPAYNPSPMKLKTVRAQKQPSPKVARRVSRKTRLKPMARTLLYALRLLIVGVGIGAIVGTVLSILDPATRMPTNPAVQSNTSNVGTNQPQPTPNAAASLYLSQEITPLKEAVQNLAAANANLTPGVFLVDLDTGAYVDVNASTPFSSASTIKVPILIAFFQDVDTGKVRLDEMLTMEQDMVAGGSGDMRSQPVGTQYTALEVATRMSTISDNTATNMLIARLGGMEALNQRFQSWGLTQTAIRNPLPDLQGTNTTSPKELGNLMAMVNRGNFVSMRSRDLMLDIMRRTERNHLLPSGLGSGARTYHKTGDIGTMLGDVGLIDIPTGKRYIAAVMVQRPHNDPAAEKLISSISRVAYQQFSQNSVPNNPTNTIPPTSYQNPVSNSPTPNPMGNTVPPGGNQTPFSTPQYFPSR